MIIPTGDFKNAETQEVTTAHDDTTHWQETGPTGGSPTGPGCSHRCIRCGAEKPVFVPQSTTRHDRRLLYAAVCLSSLITLFAISAACILPMDGTEILQIIVSYYSVGTSMTLGMLLRRKEAESKPSRQKLKTWLLGGLGFTWIGFTCGLTATNESVCGPFYFWPSPVAQCALYTIVDMFSYGLVITLLAAAYATHRRSPVLDDEKMAPSAGHLKPVGA